MKILLGQLDALIPPEHGCAKVMRLLMEALAARNHSCHIVVPFDDGRRGTVGPALRPQRLDALAARGIPAAVSPAGTVKLSHQRVHYTGTLVATGRFYRHLWLSIRQLEPDVVLVTECQVAYMRDLLATVLDAAPGRVYFYALTVNAHPFGPASFQPDPVTTALFGQTAGIIAASDFARDYIRRWSVLDATTCRLPVYGEGPFTEGGRFEDGFVTLINPCRYKGISIFAELARRLPSVAFGAVPYWGTTANDRAWLARLENVTLLPPADNIDEIMKQTRVLLVPSLGHDTFPLVVVEAMLRGIPVLASDLGGLPEAKLGVDYLLPVRPLEIGYHPAASGLGHPIVHEPAQDIQPWLTALSDVLSSRDRYIALSRQSRDAALAFLTSLGWEAFEHLLAAPHQGPLTVG